MSLPADSTAEDLVADTVAVVICFNPPAGFSQRVQSILQQVPRLIVWDNGSEQAGDLSDLSAAQLEQIELIAHPENIGIAAALNHSLARAQQLGARYAVLFDHDSTPAADMLVRLLTSHNASRSKGLPVAVTVPKISYDHPDIRCRWPQTRRWRWFFRLRYADQMADPEAVDLAISSGMLLDLSIWQHLNGFDSPLFIDLVDTEYCLHLRAHGYLVMAEPAAVLQHQLGEVEKRRLLGMDTFPTHHSALRHYYINRNRLLLVRRYAVKFPAWMAYEWLGAAKLAIKALCFEPRRWIKLKAMLAGNRDGIRLALRQSQRVGHGE